MKTILLAVLSILLVVVIAFGSRWRAPAIESDIRARTEAALAEARYDWAAVSVDGRDVVVSGAAPDDFSREQALQVANGVRGVRVVDDRMGIRPDPADAVARCQNAVREVLGDRAITFRSASAEIDAQSLPLLDRISDLLAGTPEAFVQIGGHTDAVGDDQANLRLSRERAESVLEYLAGRGIPRERMTAVGFGETHPVASNDSESGRRRNRRIEFILWRYEP